jgi:LCP family protein required for cell wall assembly
MNIVTTTENANIVSAKEAEPESEDNQLSTNEMDHRSEDMQSQSVDTNLEVVDTELEVEDIDPNIPDSPTSEILTLEDEIRKNMQENSTPIIYDEDVFNVLLIGGDSRKAGGSGRSDTMIMVSINKNSKTITATSFLRDIYLQIPGRKNNRINAAYACGGADLLMETVEQNFKIQTDRFAAIDFYAFMDVIDVLGGVTLDVTVEDIPVINNYIKGLNRLTEQEEETDCLTEAGTLLLNGKQALGYARNRYVGNGDFERTARQRRVLEQIFEKVKKLNLVKLKGLLDIVLPQITTNLSEGEIFSLILALPKYINYDIEQWSIPVSGSYTNMRIRGMAVLGIDFEENIEELHSRIYGEDDE